MKHILVILLSLSLTQTFFAQALHNREDNTLIEFTQLVSHYEGLNESDKNNRLINVYTNTYGYMLLVKSGGQMREISENRSTLLNKLLKTIFKERYIEDLYKYEVLILTDNGAFWLPIQERLSGYWKNELKKDDLALIKVRAYGNYTDESETTWFFGLNSFGANYYDMLWEEMLVSLNAGNDENGLNCLYKLIEMDPKDGQNLAALGFYYYDKGYPNEKPLLLRADSLFNVSQELSPNYPYQYYQRALVKVRLQEYEEAWKNIDKARQLGLSEHEFYQPIMEELEKALPYEKYLANKK